MLQENETWQQVVGARVLDQRWKMSAKAAAMKLAGMVKYKQQSDENEILIEVLSADAAEAAELVTAIVDAYQERRASIERNRVDRLIARANENLKAQEDKVAASRAEMLRLMQEIGIEVEIEKD